MQAILDCAQVVWRKAIQLDAEISVVNRYVAHDFSPFQFMKAGEVPTTHRLAYFLNERATHGQGVVFQQLFIAQLRQAVPEAVPLPDTTWYPRAERRYACGQIDLLLTSADGRFAICIENKPLDSTGDQPEQLARYHEYLQQHYPHYLLLYLSRSQRPPSTYSMAAETQRQLRETGQLANITYEDFMLPLLDAWREAAQPENVKMFLRQFRQHLEDWLGFASTKPTKKMKNAEIGALLAQTPERLQAAFQIAAALPELKQHYRNQLLAQVGRPADGLVGRPHWQWNEFGSGEVYHPFLIRREQLIGDTVTYPWGRYAIALEFDPERRFCLGVRFDLRNTHKGDQGVRQYNTDVAQLLGNAFPEANSNDWWPLKLRPAPENEQHFYLRMAEANGSLLKEVQEMITRLAVLLDALAEQGKLKSN